MKSLIKLVILIVVIVFALSYFNNDKKENSKEVKIEISKKDMESVADDVRDFTKSKVMPKAEKMLDNVVDWWNED